MKKKASTKKGTAKIRHLSKRAVHHVRKHVQPHAKRAHGWYKQRSIIQKLGVWLVIVVMFFVSCMYGIARWYIASNANKPLKVGVTFVPSYAESFDLDPQQTMQALIDELNIRQFRLVSYWSDYEKVQGKYDFSELDWQFKLAEESNSKVSLAIGLRQPRWPECHSPTWTSGMSTDEWLPHLKDFMKATIERYKNSPALESYQLENEFFLKAFGECPDHDRARLIDEYNFVKELDPDHPVIVARSNNAVGLPIGQPTPDEFAVSVYKRVWDKTVTKRYFEYPFPAWFYGFLAGAGKMLSGKDMIIHELQAEPWAPTDIHVASLDEQDKSLDPDRLRNRFRYGEATGMREMYLWGAEWWYWRKVKFNDSGVWDVARQEIQRIKQENCKSVTPDYENTGISGC